jgi:hypothetical protein
MSEYQLGQTLLVEPQTPFEQIAAGLEKLGWERQNGALAGKPLIQGEPETASWWWHGHKPIVIYTFNPVVKLRVLDVATLPPVMRAAIVFNLPILQETDIEKLLDSTDPRERLRGLWAAQELEKLDLIPKVDRLTKDPDSVAAEQARNVLDRLRRINEARYEALANLRMLTDAAPQLIRKLSDPAFIMGLKPTDADLAELFDGDLKPVLTTAVENVYSRKLRISPVEPDANIQVLAAAAGMLRWPNMLSEKFPLGYRDIAGWMNPRRVWLCWSITTPQGGTVRYDGLAWVNSRWVWLPKIYRYLAPYLLETPGA